AEANWGRIERWHPSPESLYEVGPLVDVGLYPLTILTAMFGPVRRVVAYAKTLEPERTRSDGTTFTLPTPDLEVAGHELADGVGGRARLQRADVRSPRGARRHARRRVDGLLERDPDPHGIADSATHREHASREDAVERAHDAVAHVDRHRPHRPSAVARAGG